MPFISPSPFDRPIEAPPTQVATSPHHQAVFAGSRFSEQVYDFPPSEIDGNRKLNKILFYDVLAEVFSFPNIYWSRGF